MLFNSCAKKLNIDKEILYSKSSCPKPDNIDSISPVNNKFSVGAQSPFQVSKLQIDSNKASQAQVQQKLSQNLLPSGYSLSLIFRSRCLENNTSNTVEFFNLDLSQKIKNYKSSFAVNLKLREAMSESELAEVLNNDKCVVGASTNKKYQAQSVSYNDPYYENQQPYFESLEHTQALNKIMNSQELKDALNQSVKIAVLDTGVDYNHPDLKNNVLKLGSGQWGYRANNGSMDAGDPMDRSTDGHGTHVAGIIAAQAQNNEGGVGLASFAKILAVNVFDDHDQGYYALSSDVYNGIQRAIQENVDIINLSVGQFSETFEGDSSYMQGLIEAVANNILVVTVIGNDTGEYNTAEVDGENLTVIPGIYGASMDGVLTVASVDARTNTLSNFSLYSQVYAEIAAPGSVGEGQTDGIYSTTKSTSSSVPYGYMKGTSMAAPVVSSVAGLAVAVLKHKGQAYSAKNLEDLLKMTAHRSYKLDCKVRDNQILNSLNLVEYLQSI